MNDTSKQSHRKLTKQEIYRSTRSIYTQRQQRGFSLSFLALLLNLHETSLMNFESGAILPTNDIALRMKMLGFALSTEENNNTHIPPLDCTAYELLSNIPNESLKEMNDDISLYLSVNHHLGRMVQRNVVLMQIINSYHNNTKTELLYECKTNKFTPIPTVTQHSV